MYSLADLNEIFFKIDTSFELSPLFEQQASVDGYTQEGFLKAFYPTSFLMKVGKKSKEEDKASYDKGVYFDKARRSKLFNGALPDSRKRSLRYEIIFCITLEEWANIHTKCKALCETCSEEAAAKLDTFLNEVIKENKRYIPKTMEPALAGEACPLDVKLAMVMFLYLFLPLDVTEEEMQDDNLLALGTEILEQLDVVVEQKSKYEILRYEDGYEYIEFGEFPQTVVTDEETLKAFRKIEDEQLSQMMTCTGADLAEQMKAQKKQMDYDGLPYAGSRYIRKVMCLNSFLVDPPSNYMFSTGEQVKNEAYYCKIEPIRWRILEKRETENGTELFLISERILFQAPFNEHIKHEHGYFCQSRKEYAYSWAASDLRDKLNSNFSDSFINRAFSEEEKSCIVDSTNDQSAGWYFHHQTTKDKIFVLSEQEASAYLFRMTDDEYEVAAFRREHGYDYPRTALRAVGLLTDYALLTGVRPYDLTSYGAYFQCPHYHSYVPWGKETYEMPRQGRLWQGELPRTGAYWLRSPGDKNARILDADKEMDYTRRVATITPGGSLDPRGATVDGGRCEYLQNEFAKDGLEIGVRPAMRIVLSEKPTVVDKRETIV